MNRASSGGQFWKPISPERGQYCRPIHSEINLPSGDQLKENIIALVKPASDQPYGFANPHMQQMMRQYVGNDIHIAGDKLKPFIAASSKMVRGLPLAMSIDNYLHTHQQDKFVVKLGKLAIAISILDAERNSYLFQRKPAGLRLQGLKTSRQPTVHEKELSGTWYPKFARQLFSGVQRENIATAFENVKFVIFNYDRCLEQYLWLAIQDYFDVDSEAASAVLENVIFSHPYGSLGMLPWRAKSNASLKFGSGEAVNYWIVSERIRTFTESVRGQVAHRVAAAIGNAETLLLLGFGYLDQNIQLLQSGSEKKAQRAITTAFGVSEADQQIIRQAMRTLCAAGHPETLVEGGACRDLFDHYRLLMSLS